MTDPTPPAGGGSTPAAHAEPTNPEWPLGWLIVIGVVTVAWWVVAVALYVDWIDWTVPQRFAIGVGGTALFALILGIGRLTTVRGAASLAVIVLLIGAATWPAASSFFPSDIRTSIIQWTGIILGAAAVAEAGTQIAATRSSVKLAGLHVVNDAGELVEVTPEPIAAPGDLGRRR